jgi:hypothetical protein
MDVHRKTGFKHPSNFVFTKLACLLETCIVLSAVTGMKKADEGFIFKSLGSIEKLARRPTYSLKEAVMIYVHAFRSPPPLQMLY